MLPLEPKWLSISADKVNALDIKGYRRRAYYYNEFFNTYVGWNAETQYDRFILIVYQNENDLMCEIRYMESSYNLEPVSEKPSSKTIDPDIIRKFYDALRGDFVNSRIEEIDGRMFIHGIETNTPIRSHYGKYTIGRMFAGMLVESYGSQLCVAIRWNEKLPTFSDICDVCRRLSSMVYNANGIKNNFYGCKKKSMSDMISHLRKEIDELNGKMEKICELSANAMNTLSEKYGIEVSI